MCTRSTTITPCCNWSITTGNGELFCRSRRASARDLLTCQPRASARSKALRRSAAPSRTRLDTGSDASTDRVRNPASIGRQPAMAQTKNISVDGIQQRATARQKNRMTQPTHSHAATSAVMTNRSAEWADHLRQDWRDHQPDGEQRGEREYDNDAASVDRNASLRADGLQRPRWQTTERSGDDYARAGNIPARARRFVVPPLSVQRQLHRSIDFSGASTDG